LTARVSADEAAALTISQPVIAAQTTDAQTIETVSPMSAATVPSVSEPLVPNEVHTRLRRCECSMRICSTLAGTEAQAMSTLKVTVDQRCRWSERRTDQRKVSLFELEEAVEAAHLAQTEPQLPEPPETCVRVHRQMSK